MGNLTLTSYKALSMYLTAHPAISIESYHQSPKTKGPANFLCKGSDHRYFQFCGPYRVCGNY